MFGSHLSIAGGLHNALLSAEKYGMDTVQVFTKNQQQWKCAPLSEQCIADWKSHAKRLKFRKTVSHDSYLINLASPDPFLQLRSMISFIAELKRCEALGVEFLVSHPGNFMDDRASGIDRNVDGIVAGLECVPGRTILLLETTAGSGTSLGASFEEMAALLQRVPRHLQKRVAVCADTAHLFASGYDLAGGFDGVWARFEDVIGLDRLRMLHLNDSKVPLGSRRDRHELIGEGAIGAGAFRRIMTDPRFASIPKVIETPKLDDAESTDRRMLALLRSFAEEPVDAPAMAPG